MMQPRWRNRMLRAALVLALPLAAAAQDTAARQNFGTKQPAPTTRRTLEAPVSGGAPRAGTPASDAEVYAALHRPIPEITYNKTPLGDVIRDLRRRLDINVHVQAEQLAANGIELSKTVSLTLKNVPAQRVLALLLEDAGADVALGFDVLDGVLVISSRDALEKQMVLRTHSIADLIADGAPHAAPLTRDERAERGEEIIGEIAELIRDTIAPDSWVDTGGGDGVIRDVAGVLAIRNTPDAHQLAHALLEGLRTVPRGGSVTIPPSSAAENAADEAIRAALRRVLPSVSYDGVPFDAVLDDLRRQLNINVHAFVSDLQQRGVKSDKPVHLQLQNVTAERMLRQVLSDVGGDVRLTFEVEAGVLVIATDDYLQHHKVIRVYGIGDVAPTFDKAQQLLSVITETVEPDSWVSNGGDSNALLYDHRLVVRNSPRTHRDIESLLSAVRQPPASAPASR
jgi:hypothetical protein